MPISEAELKNLTTGKLLARNTIWNLVGEGAPLLVALVAIPRLVHALGTQRFGILTLVWMLIGYLSLFDLGVGRALTNLIAQQLGAGEEKTLPPLIWTANILIIGLGIAGGLLLASLSRWLVYSVLKIPAGLQKETLDALYVLSLALPAVISTTGFRGIMEAYQRFDVANAIRIPMGIFSFAAPLAVLPFSHSLVPIVVVLVAGRFIALLVHIAACVALLPVMRSAVQWQSDIVRPLLSFGGWMTVSNIVGPIMAGMDRFLVGALVSIQAVAFYATPYEVVTKLWLVPAALAGVLFPAFSTTLMSDPARTRRLYSHARKTLMLVMAPIALAFIIAARPGLRLWLGAEFAANSALVLQVLAFGVFMNSVAFLPFALVQGAGRSDWTGKLHIAELPVYLAAFWVLTTHLGIVGTAIAWSLRVTGDLVLLMIMARKLLRAYSRPAVATVTIRDLPAKVVESK